MIRGEALYSSRSAWYVCFPGTSAKDRLTNFKGPGRDTNEMALAERTLTLFSALAEMGINEKAQLMTAGDTARAALREKMSITDEELMSAALAKLGLGDKMTVVGVGPVSREESPELEDCAGGREVSDCPAEEIMTDTLVKAEPEPLMPPPQEYPAEELGAEILIVAPMEAEQGPPLPPPPEPPMPPSMPPSQEDPTAPSSLHSPALVCTEASGDPALAGEQVASAMRKYAAQIRKTGKLVGIFPFLVWSLVHRLRVEVHCGRGRIDPVAEFASWAKDLLREPATPLIVIWSRVFRCVVNGNDCIVVRALNGEADQASGNHWVAGLHTRGIDRASVAYQHPPCNGRLCAGGSSRHCLGPVRSAAAAMNVTVIPTVAQGDCAFDAMAFWAGGARDLGTWKKLRHELAQAIADHALDPNWQAAFQSCGEYDPPEADDAPVGGPSGTTSKSSKQAVTSALAEVSHDSRPVPVEMVDAVRWALGLTDKERHLAENLAKHMDSLEQEAVLKWRGDDSVSAASALAGAKGELPNKRRLDVTLRLKRAWGGMLCTWCTANEVKLRWRLPWGTMARFWAEHGGKRDCLDGRQLLRYARKAQQGELVVKGGKLHLMSRRRREGAGRPHKAPALRELLFEWFCMVRGAVTGRLPPAALAAQARVLRMQYMKHALEYSLKVSMPQITSKWLRGFRREYGISLRI